MPNISQIIAVWVHLWDSQLVNSRGRGRLRSGIQRVIFDERTAAVVYKDVLAGSLTAPNIECFKGMSIGFDFGTQYS